MNLKKPAGFLDTNFKMLQKLKNKGFAVLVTAMTR